MLTCFIWLNPRYFIKARMEAYMFPAKFAHILFSLILSIMMSCIVSGIATYSAVGLIDHFFLSWMISWGKSWVVAFPAILIVAPIARKFVNKITLSP